MLGGGFLGPDAPCQPGLGIPFPLPTSILYKRRVFFRGPGELPGASWGLEWKTSTSDPCLAKNAGLHPSYAMAFYFNTSFLRTEALGWSHGLTQPAFSL